MAEHLAQGLLRRVLEVDLGTGLNVLLTAHRAASFTVPLQNLEKDVLPADVLAGLNHSAQRGATALCDALLAWRRALPDVVSPYLLAFAETRLLDLVVGDATEVALPHLAYDAVSLDAFSPKVKPELWTPALPARLLALMRSSGAPATYLARGVGRCSLEAVELGTGKRSGSPGKRERLVAVR